MFFFVSFLCPTHGASVSVMMLAAATGPPFLSGALDMTRCRWPGRSREQGEEVRCSASNIIQEVYMLAYVGLRNALHYTYIITYGPHKAVAEVSNHNVPIGRKSGIQLVRKIRKSMGFTFSCFVLN